MLSSSPRPTPANEPNRRKRLIHSKSAPQGVSYARARVESRLGKKRGTGKWGGTSLSRSSLAGKKNTFHLGVQTGEGKNGGDSPPPERRAAGGAKGGNGR